MPDTSSRRNQYLHLHYGCGDEHTGYLPLVFQVPDLAPVSVSMVPDELICYARIPKRKPSPPRDPSLSYCVHFYTDDYRFGALEKDIQRAISVLRDYSAVLTPDYSLYRDMDLTVQRINILRSRTVGYLMQEAGLIVIPTVSWSDERSYEFCFDGLPKNSVLSVSSVGVLRDEEARRLFINGYHAMIERLNPSCIMFYGKIPDWLDRKDVPVRNMNTQHSTGPTKRKRRPHNMGGRGARSELYDIMHDKPYGTEYTCVAKIGNCKILRYGDGKQSKAPVETRTRGRVYAVLDRKENIAYIVFYDRNNKRVRQIDFRHNHKVNGIPTCPHTHVGYYHDERDTRKLTDNERKRATRIITYWNKKRNNNNVR